jgi:protein phosphatase
MKMKVCQKSDVGLVRKENQDNMAWFTPPQGELFIVADGMGGHAGGRTAADMAIQTIREVFENDLSSSIPNLIKSSVEEANSRIHQKASSGDFNFYKMGTTVVLLFIKDNFAYVAHVGDSRIYLYRDAQLKRLTKDHSQVQMMVDNGLISADEAFEHPHSNILYRSVGSKPKTDVDITPEPFAIYPGDKFLMCTDGLSGLARDPEIQAVFADTVLIDDLCNNLVDLALKKGGDDNVTVQIVSFINDIGVSEQNAPPQPPQDCASTPTKEKTPINIAVGFGTILLIAILAGLFFFLKEPDSNKTDKKQDSPTNAQQSDSPKNNETTQDANQSQDKPPKDNETTQDANRPQEKPLKDNETTQDANQPQEKPPRNNETPQDANHSSATPYENGQSAPSANNPPNNDDPKKNEQGSVINKDKGRDNGSPTKKENPPTHKRERHNGKGDKEPLEDNQTEDKTKSNEQLT